jgi:anti-sigma factor RsiW
MSADCRQIDPLVTPYVDGQLPDADRVVVDRHLKLCPPCYSRVAAERAVSELIRARRDALSIPCAPGSLRAKCVEAAHRSPRAFDARFAGASRVGPVTWQSRLGPLAVAASLVAIVGGAFTYQLTVASERVMAAELAADHLKCFALNGVLHTHEEAATVESSMLSSFGWQMHLPTNAASAGLELVGARPCMYGVGKVAHIMYRHNGEPMSLFMLPKVQHAEQVMQVLGHGAAIWCVNNRTFVLVAREPKDEVERLARVVQASLR